MPTKVKWVNILKALNIITFLFLLTSAANAQNIDAALADYNKATHFEKAYVQFNNSRFMQGQTIWYKAYLLSGFQPSLISKNFYIDWYDDKGQLISSTATPVIYSYSSGSFTIPEKYSGKFIRANAYTRWMRNFDSSYFYQQTFQIISASSEMEKKDISIHTIAVQFLPESGTILSDKLNVIAFKAINGSGKPAAISGVIENSKGDSITSFISVHDGMGKFQFVPVNHESYKAVWADMSGNIHRSNLPASEDSAVNLILEKGGANRIFHIQRTKAAPERMKKLTMVGQMNGSILFKANLNLTDKESITSSLPTSKILSGILQLTVFDADLQPLCERLLFVKNDDYLLNATFHADTLNTGKRGKNVFEIELQDTSYTNLSMSVTDADINDSPNNNIISQLLLKGDIAGHIYEPAYYFASNADSVLNHLDLVMLTNGWRRYNWKEMLRNPLPVLRYTKDSGYQSIKGRIANYKPKKSKTPELINLIFVAKDSSGSSLTLPIMEDGSFSGENNIFFDSARVYYKIQGARGLSPQDIFIETDLFKTDAAISQSSFFPEPDTAGFSKFQNLVKREADTANKYHALKEITVYSKEKSGMKEMDIKYTSGLFSAPAAAAFDMGAQENAGHRSSIYDFLTGKIQGLVIGATNGGTATENIAEYRRGAPTFYLDETAIPTSELDNINLANVAYIKVFNPPFAGGLNGSGGQIASGGAIAIYTKRGADVRLQKTNFELSGVDYKLISGYAPVKEFYQPDYAEKKLADDVEDIRSTLLWNPWINLSKTNRKVKIVFYNNDVTRSFRIIIEGMDGKGRLLHISKFLN